MPPSGYSGQHIVRALYISNAEVKSTTNYSSTFFDCEPAPSPFVARLPSDLYANRWLLGLDYRGPRHHLLRLRQNPSYSPRRVHLLRSLVRTVTTLTDMPLTASTPCGYHARMVHTFTQLFVSIGSLRIVSRVPFPELVALCFSRADPHMRAHSSKAISHLLHPQ